MTAVLVRVEADLVCFGIRSSNAPSKSHVVQLCARKKTNIKIVPWACPKQNYTKRWKIVFFQYLQQLISLQGQSGQIVDFILGSINKIFLLDRCVLLQNCFIVSGIYNKVVFNTGSLKMLSNDATFTECGLCHHRWFFESC